MSHRAIASPLLSLLLTLLTIVACAAPQPTLPPTRQAPTYLPPTATPQPPAPSPAPPTATPLPFEGPAEWDVVIISDSSLWGVAEPYAKLIEQDRGVEVIMHDEWQGGLSAGAILQALRGDSGGSFKRAQWSQLVRDAEVLVIFGNPLDSVSPEMQSDLESCIMSQQPTGCTTEALAPYQADLEAIYDEIARLREGQPLILRATDIYNPLLSLWREKGIEDACRVCWDAVNHSARQSAKDRGVLFVSVYDAFNGLNHDQDPRARGLIRDDGEHPSEAGAQFIADLLQQSGYAYAGN